VNFELTGYPEMQNEIHADIVQTYRDIMNLEGCLINLSTTSGALELDPDDYSESDELKPKPINKFIQSNNKNRFQLNNFKRL